MYHRLAMFYKKNGHSNVPNRYPEDPQLGSWGTHVTCWFQCIDCCLSFGACNCMIRREGSHSILICVVGCTGCTVLNAGCLVDACMIDGCSRHIIYTCPSTVSAQRRAYKNITSGAVGSAAMTLERATKLKHLHFEWEAMNPNNVRVYCVCTLSSVNDVN